MPRIRFILSPSGNYMPKIRFILYPCGIFMPEIQGRLPPSDVDTMWRDVYYSALEKVFLCRGVFTAPHSSKMFTWWRNRVSWLFFSRSCIYRETRKHPAHPAYPTRNIFNFWCRMSGIGWIKSGYDKYTRIHARTVLFFITALLIFATALLIIVTTLLIIVTTLLFFLSTAYRSLHTVVVWKEPTESTILYQE